MLKLYHNQGEKNLGAYLTSSTSQVWRTDAHTILPAVELKHKNATLLTGAQHWWCLPKASKGTWLFWVALQRAATRTLPPAAPTAAVPIQVHQRQNMQGLKVMAAKSLFKCKNQRSSCCGFFCLFVFLSKYSTLNHSEAPRRKAKTRNYTNRTANITNPPTLLDRKACKGSPSERLVNTRILTLLSRNRNREHLSQQELNPWLFHFYFLISFGNYVPQQILVNTYNKLVVETLSATLAAVS